MAKILDGKPPAGTDTTPDHRGEAFEGPDGDSLYLHPKHGEPGYGTRD